MENSEDQRPGQFIFKMNRRIEILISLSLVIVTMVFMAPIFRGMASGSLGTDERGTVTRYSARGPLRTITRYDLAKNHIFFNLLNSVTPAPKSLNSLRVRLWSYLFLAASGIAALVYFARRGWFFEGALWFYFWGVNAELVTLNLQARGYGFLSFVTLSLGILAISYFETGNKRTLRTLCILVALGAWTIPSFVIFGATLLLFLLWSTRSREVMIASAVTMASIAVLYSPVVGQVLQVMRKYDGQYGQAYATIDAVYSTLRYYLFPASDNLLFAILIAAFVAPFALWSREEAIGRGLRVVMGTVFVFFLACLTMKTPPVRTTALTIAPMLFCLVHALGVFLRNARLASVRSLIAAAVSVPLFVHANHAIANYRFLPAENWLGIAHALETIFPADTTTFGGGNTITAYVKKRYIDLDVFDKEAFLKGKSVAIDFKKFRNVEEVDVSALSPRVVSIQIPQTVSGFQTLWFVPPEDSGVTGVAETGGKLKIPGTVPIKLRPGVAYYSLNLFVKDLPTDLQVEAVVGGIRYPMEPFQSAAGSLFSLRLKDGTLTDASLRFSSSKNPGSAVSVANIWANQDSTEESRK